MTNYTKGQEVLIKTGSYAGETAWFMDYSRRTSDKTWCFIQLKRPNYKGAQLKVSDIEAVA